MVPISPQTLIGRLPTPSSSERDPRHNRIRSRDFFVQALLERCEIAQRVGREAYPLDLWQHRLYSV
jgi:hypothetical protein